MDHRKHIYQQDRIWVKDCATCEKDFADNPPRFFFVVWVDNAGPPTVKFETRWRAEMSKRAMAHKEVNRLCHVLKVKSSTVVTVKDGIRTEVTRLNGEWRPGHKHARRRQKAAAPAPRPAAAAGIPVIAEDLPIIQRTRSLSVVSRTRVVPVIGLARSVLRV